MAWLAQGHTYLSQCQASQSSSWSRPTPSNIVTESHLQCVTFKFLIQNETKVSPLVPLAIFQKSNSHLWRAAPERGVTESSSAGPIESLTDPCLESTGWHSDPSVEPESGLGVRLRKEKGAGKTSSRAADVQVTAQRA